MVSRPWGVSLAVLLTLGCHDHPSPLFLSLPSKCPEGTCDGCTFHFLWVTAEGCPRCSSSHHRPIVGACIGGVQVLPCAPGWAVASTAPEPPFPPPENHLCVAGAPAVPWWRCPAAAGDPGVPEHGLLAKSWNFHWDLCGRLAGHARRLFLEKDSKVSNWRWDLGTRGLALSWEGLMAPLAFPGWNTNIPSW